MKIEVAVESRPLFLVEERIKTFKKWPFDYSKKCNVRNMAEAGFYSVATGDSDIDAAKCFLCGKELDGWEENDDPWLEHKSHASKCAYVQLGKRSEDLLLLEYISVIKQFMINEIKQLGEIIKDATDLYGKKVARQF